VARQARGHDVERIGRIAAMRGGIGEERDQLAEPKERIGEAVREDQRDRIGASPALVDEVDVEPADEGAELREPIDFGFGCAPVEFGPPVGREPV
jgi:hypothetical protein